jgi:hypothetical protein
MPGRIRGRDAWCRHKWWRPWRWLKKARRRREVAPTLQRLPADDRLRSSHPVPRTPPTFVGRPGGSSLVSPTPSVVDSGVSSTDPAAILHFAILHLTSSGLNVKSPTGSERTLRDDGYFFFFAAALRFTGAFFFAAVFAFAFFTMLPS